MFSLAGETYRVRSGGLKYYDEALAYLEREKQCYQTAGLESKWDELAAELRRDHRRKHGFMPGFERIARGAGPVRTESFLDQARRHWTRQTKP